MNSVAHLDCVRDALAHYGQPAGAWVLFVRRPGVYTATSTGGELQYLLTLKGRRGRLERDVLGIWGGPRAAAWMAMHRMDVKPGRSLLVTFSDVAAHLRDGRAEQLVYLETVQLLAGTDHGGDAQAAGSFSTNEEKQTS